MFDNLLEKLGFKKKKKPLYTKKQFTKYSNYKGDTYVYDSYSNQWLLWYLIADDVDDGNISEYDMIKDNEHSIMADKLYNTELSEETCLPEYTPVDSLSDLEKSIKASSYEDFGTSDSYSGSSSSSDWSSSSSSSSSDSYSSSSYDSGSSSSFSSSDSGGCF